MPEANFFFLPKNPVFVKIVKLQKKITEFFYQFFKFPQTCEIFFCWVLTLFGLVFLAPFSLTTVRETEIFLSRNHNFPYQKPQISTVFCNFSANFRNFFGGAPTTISPLDIFKLMISVLSQLGTRPLPVNGMLRGRTSPSCCPSLKRTTKVFLWGYL